MGFCANRLEQRCGLEGAVDGIDVLDPTKFLRSRTATSLLGRSRAYPCPRRFAESGIKAGKTETVPCREGVVGSRNERRICCRGESVRGECSEVRVFGWSVRGGVFGGESVRGESVRGGSVRR